jgi:cytochrome c biogenesis protein CcmG/thiol:disulfide interchange protein DsbE
MCGKYGNAQPEYPKVAPSRIILVLFVLCGISYSVLSQTTRPQISLEKALEHARAITNIEIHYDDVLWIQGMTNAPKPFSNDFVRTCHISYIASNGKYRSECVTESPSTTNIVRIIQDTFDGKLWSEFSSSGVMTEQDGDHPNDAENPYNPLVCPFLFHSPASDENFPGPLRFADLHDPDILRCLFLPAGEHSAHMNQMSFTGLPRNRVNQLWSIDIDDIDPDFKPRIISQTVYMGGQRPFENVTTYILSDYTNLDRYYFPTKIAYRSVSIPTNHLLSPMLELTGIVTMVSIVTPQQIPDSTFRLDESKAKLVWNTRESKGYGVGLVLADDGSNIVVKRIVPDSAAGAQNELHTGDRILSIADSNAPAFAVHDGMANLSRAIALLQGPKGTSVQVTFVPSSRSDSQTGVVTLLRGDVRERLSGAPLLTSGMKAPEIEMLTLTNRATEHLSDHRGKIVVLEFWATWCTPCQKSMADLQLDPLRNPSWKDKVDLIAVSVDDTPDIADRRVRFRGWNQTHNVWLKTDDFNHYGVGGIPYAYVIDEKGNIAASGIVEAGRLNIPDAVNQQISVANSKPRQH